MAQSTEELEAELELMLTQVVEAEELLAADPDDEEVKSLVKEVEDALADLEAKIEESKRPKPTPPTAAVVNAPSSGRSNGGTSLVPPLGFDPIKKVQVDPPTSKQGGLVPQQQAAVAPPVPVVVPTSLIPQFVVGPLGTVGSLCLALFDGRHWLRAVVKTAEVGGMFRVEFLGYIHSHVGGYNQQAVPQDAASIAVATERVGLDKMKAWRPEMPTAGAKVQAYHPKQGTWTDATVERISPTGNVMVRFGSMGTFGNTDVDILELHIAHVNVERNQPVPLRRRQVLTAAEIAEKTARNREKQKERKQAKAANQRAKMASNTADWAAFRDDGSGSEDDSDVGGAPAKKKARIF